MKAIYILSLFTLILLTNVSSQSCSWLKEVDYTAATSYCGNGAYYGAFGKSIACDNFGNVYVAGYFNSNYISVGGHSLQNVPCTDRLLFAKYNSNGVCVWAKTSTAFGYGKSIATDANGNVYLSGYCSGTLIFGPDSLYLINGVFLAKFDSSGNIIWLKGINQTSNQQSAIVTDANDNVFLASSFQGTANVGGVQLTSNGQEDIVVAKFDNNGNVVWAKNIGGTTRDLANGIAKDALNNIYITGIFQSATMNFGSTTLSQNGSKNFYVLKYDSSGNELWAKSYGGIYGDEAKSICTDVNNNIYVVGNFISPVFSFGIDTITNSASSSEDIFLASLNSNGVERWVRSVIGSGISVDLGNGIASDSVGNIFITGSFLSPQLNFGSVILNKSGAYEDLFVAKYDSLGNNLGAKKGNGNSIDNSKSISSMNGNLYLTGDFLSNNLIISPDTIYNSLPSFLNTNIFIAKIKDIFYIDSTYKGCSNLSNGQINISTNGSDPPYNYLWNTGQISSNLNGLSSGVYSLTIHDAIGCSIIYTYNLVNFTAPSVIANNTYLCNGTGYITVNNPNSSYQYSWNTGQSGIVTSINTTGIYSVTATDTNGCSRSDTANVINYSNCGGYLEISSDTAINYFDTLRVEVKIHGAFDAFSAYAKIHFDNNLLVLAESTPGNFFGTNIIATPPIITGDSIDFGITKIAGQVGSNGDGVIFNFKFVLKNLPSLIFDAVHPTNTFTQFNLNNLSIYNSLGNHPSSFNTLSLLQSKTKIRYYVPVWPGDLNNDYSCNVSDILPIGYFYNSSGPIRPGGNLSWTAQPAPVWGQDKTYINSSAYKTFADGNADGQIDLADQAAIGFNLNNFHLRINQHYQFIEHVSSSNKCNFL